jgi:hypothetical protein
MEYFLIEYFLIDYFLMEFFLIEFFIELRNVLLLPILRHFAPFPSLLGVHTFGRMNCSQEPRLPFPMLHYLAACIMSFVPSPRTHTHHRMKTTRLSTDPIVRGRCSSTPPFKKLCWLCRRNTINCCAVKRECSK